jgi:hypothetical protein
MNSKKELKSEFKQIKNNGRKNLSITFLDFYNLKKELEDDEEIIALTTRASIRNAYRVYITNKRILIRPRFGYEYPNYDIEFEEVYKDSIAYKKSTIIIFETNTEKIEAYDVKNSYFDYLKEKTKENKK